MKQSAPARPPSDPEPNNRLSTHTSPAPPPHDYPPSVCPTESLPGLALPQPGNTLHLHSTLVAVKRHMPTPLTPPDPGQAISEQSRTTPPFSRRAGTTHAGVFSTPSKRTFLATPYCPFHCNATVVAPNSAKIFYVTTPTEFLQIYTDVATFPASTSACFTDRLYILRRQERLDRLSRSASPTCPLTRTGA
jgi:hypothetical protein